MIDYRKTYAVTSKKMFGKGKDLAIKIEIQQFGDHEELYYDAFERPHTLIGKTKKNLNNGIIFHSTTLNTDFTFTELTMQEFDEFVRPHLPPEVSRMLNDLDDIYVWARQQVGIN